MTKLYFYELKRLMWNPMFFGLLFVTLFYSWQVLNHVTLLGVSDTAPFSSWSFGDYLSRILPLLWIGALFFVTFFTSRTERRVAVLTSATPIKQRVYGWIRCCAALTGTGILCLATLLLAVVFYIRLFGWCPWRNLLFPALITLAPALIFAIGSGWALGRIQPYLVFAWMLLPVVLLALPLPKSLGMWNGSFFTNRPLSLGILDPAFSVPIEVIMIQCAVLCIGVLLIVEHPQRKKSR